jgi:hypothetical protein
MSSSLIVKAIMSGLSRDDIMNIAHYLGIERDTKLTKGEERPSTVYIPSISLFRPEGFKWTHGGKATYKFTDKGEFSSSKISANWTIEDQEDGRKLLKIVFGVRKGTQVYFRWPLQFGDNVSIVEKQTGYKADTAVILFC